MRISRPYITDIKSDLIPDASGTRDIGSASLAFAEGHFDQLYVAQDSLHIGAANLSAPSGMITFEDVTGITTLGDLVDKPFTGLSDTPSTYSGFSASGVRVNTGETGLEFYDAGGSGGSGGAGSSRTITQASHGFSVADIIRWDQGAGDYTLARADTVENAEAIGIVSEVPDSSNFVLSYTGFITLVGQTFTPGDVQFLSAAASGAMTSTEPSEVNQVSKPIFIPVTQTDGYIFNWRGSVNAGGVNTGMIIDATPNTDKTGNGITTTMTAGASGSIGDVLYQNADGKLHLADADSASTMPGLFLATTDSTDGYPIDVMTQGYYRDDSWGWTVGGLMYVTPSGTMGNTIGQTAPVGVGDQVQVVGVATASDIIYFNPSMVLVEIT